MENQEKDLIEIFDFWNSCKIQVHRVFTDSAKMRIKKRLKEGFTKEEIKRSIYNYMTILKGNEYWFTYTWGLKDFISSGMEKFLEFKVCQDNFRIVKKEKQFVDLIEYPEYQEVK